MSYQKRFHVTIFLIASCLSSLFNYQDATCQTYDIYGLKFASYEVKKDNRTSLDLTPEKALEVSTSFTLSFDFRYYRAYSAYGYIFRLITNNSVNFDLLSKASSLLDNDLEFVAGSIYTKVHYKLDEIVNDPIEDWIHSIVHFDLDKNAISISLNGITKTDTFDIKDIKDIRIVFGANNYNRFSTSDVPPVILKNIKIESDSKYKRDWKLDQYQKAEIIDIINRSKAEVVNPVWLIDNHSKWKRRSLLTVKRNSQIAFNGQDSKVFIVEDDHMQVVNLSTDSVSTIKYRYGRPFLSPSNQLIYNVFKNELWDYIINVPRIARYNFKSNTWDNTDPVTPEPAYWHHNKFFSLVDHRLMVFGGYGFYRYKNQLFGFDEGPNKWEAIKVNGFIKPRYLSALGYSTKPDEVLIFGGFGNDSGKQELSPESLYDLYSLNLKNYSFTKLWELSNVDISFALSSSLIADSAKDCFYTLCYPVHKYRGKLYLARFGISNPEMTIISDSIPYLFQDTESYCDLFFNAPTKELIAITSSSLENNLSEISIYSLSFPPVKPGISQSKMLNPGSKKLILMLFYVLMILLVGAAVSILYKKRRIFQLNGKKEFIPVNVSERVLNGEAIKNVNNSESGVNFVEESTVKIRKCTIQFLGGFQVTCKNNHQITGLFTPTLKQLFVMILLSSGESGKGVPSEQLRDNIWFKKSKESARNIRGVYIRKLRMILDDIGDVQLINSNGYWTIRVGPEVDYDYGRVMALLHNIRHNESIGQNLFSELVLLGSKGTLLPNMENEWLDKYKADYSSEIIDVLLDISKRLDLQKDIKLIIQISDAVFSNDPLNEDALHLKCKVLNDNGKHSLAKSVFESFARDYLNSMGSDFDRSFNDMII